MGRRTLASRSAGPGLLLCIAAITPSVQAAEPSPLAGTWTLVAADVIRPDGTRARDYGESPQGLLMIDGQGRYSAQIYQSERPRFASGRKDGGSAAEYRQAILGCSTHFGTIEVDAAGRIITVRVQRSSYPNQDDTEQKREFQLQGDELSYRVPPRPDGGIPISIWRRLAP